MLYLSLFCLNLSYKSLDVYNSGGGVVPNSDVYKYSDPTDHLIMACLLNKLVDPQTYLLSPHARQEKFEFVTALYSSISTVERFRKSL